MLRARDTARATKLTPYSAGDAGREGREVDGHNARMPHAGGGHCAHQEGQQQGGIRIRINHRCPDVHKHKDLGDGRKQLEKGADLRAAGKPCRRWQQTGRQPMAAADAPRLTLSLLLAAMLGFTRLAMNTPQNSAATMPLM